jgi:hypothetical protein
LNWGTGSSFLNALVKALDKLHMVRAENSGVFWLEIQVMDLGQQALGSVHVGIDEGRVEDQLRLGVGELRLLPELDLALHRLEVSLNAVHTYGEGVDQVEALAVLGQDRREDCGNAKGNFYFERTVRYRRSNDEDQEMLD